MSRLRFGGKESVYGAGITFFYDRFFAAMTDEARDKSFCKFCQLDPNNAEPDVDRNQKLGGLVDSLPCARSFTSFCEI
jgi:hypothetical protein